MCLFHKISPNTSILLSRTTVCRIWEKRFYPSGISAPFSAMIPAIWGIEFPQIDIGWNNVNTNFWVVNTFLGKYEGYFNICIENLYWNNAFVCFLVSFKRWTITSSSIFRRLYFPLDFNNDFILRNCVFYKLISLNQKSGSVHLFQEAWFHKMIERRFQKIM